MGGDMRRLRMPLGGRPVLTAGDHDKLGRLGRFARPRTGRPAAHLNPPR
jgi:hypothetical protein